MFHNPIWKRAIAFIIIFSIVSSSFAGELSLPSDKRWIMIASRSTFEEAKQIINKHDNQSYAKYFMNTYKTIDIGDKNTNIIVSKLTCNF